MWQRPILAAVVFALLAMAAVLVNMPPLTGCRSEAPVAARQYWFRATHRCGKLVVAKDSADLPALDELLKRGMANGIKLEDLNETDAKKIEPRVTYQRALFSPTTSTVNPNVVIQEMVTDAIAEVPDLRNPFLGKEALGNGFRVGGR